MSIESTHRYFLTPSHGRPIIEMVAVEPQTWELMLLRDLSHAEEDTSIYRLAATNEDPLAPETAGRERAVLRVMTPDNPQKMLLALEPIEIEHPVRLINDDGSEENLLPASVTLFRPVDDGESDRHYRTDGLDG